MQSLSSGAVGDYRIMLASGLRTPHSIARPGGVRDFVKPQTDANRRPLPAREGVIGEEADSTSVRPACDLVSPNKSTNVPKKPLICSGFLKPSDGLEPSTPSLP